MDAGAIIQSVVIRIPVQWNILNIRMSRATGETGDHDDFAEVVWQTKMQVMAEDLTDSLEKKLGAHILFASSEENGRIIKVEAYSTPVENSMYAIYLSSDQHGVIDSITVFFFDSLDVMYHHLRKDYQSITKVVGDIIEKQSLQDLVGIFI